MNELIFNEFTLTITPNETPKWDGSVPYLSFQEEVRIIKVALPINTVGGYTEYVELELWIENNAKQDESEMSISGILNSTRNISRQVTPVVIASCPSFLEVDEDEDGEYDYAEYDILYAETFEEAVYQLFEGTGWTVKIACAPLNNFPVVTEAEPILVLNGSKLEQLGNMLAMFTPNDLWDQDLVFVVNPFINEIIITPPTNGETNVNILDISSVRAFDVSVNEKDIEIPQKIYLQEDPSALFRHISHFEEYGYRLYEYTFETSLHEDIVNATHSWADRFEDWEKDLDIIAKLSGEQIIVGDTVIVDVEETSIFTIETRIMYAQHLNSMQFPILGGPFLDWSPAWYKWVTTRATNIKSRTEYSYIIGPPYDNPILYIPCDESKIIVLDEGEDNWWDNLPYSDEEEGLPEEITEEEEETICISDENQCFQYSLPWNINQLARDYGAIIIDKDHLPLYITSNDSLRIYTKKIIAIEQEGKEIFYTDDNTNETYTIPAFEELDTIDTSVTITEERYSYDGEGNLVGVHEHKQTKTATEIVVEDTFRIYKPITEGLTSVITYTISRRYDVDYNLITTSITNVDADTVTGNVSGPSAVSPLESAEEKQGPREELFRQNTERIVLKLVGNSLSNVTDSNTGVLYITIENLTLEEMEQYLVAYYNLSPRVGYELGFSSHFMDVRGIIGGYLKLTTSVEPNRPQPYDIEPSVSEKTLNDSGVILAMAERAFRVDALTMNWDKEGKLTTAIVSKQVI